MHPLQNKIIKGVNHGHIIIPLSMWHFFFKYRNHSVQEMIHLLKFVSTSLKTLEAVQWILLTILLSLKNQYDGNTEICYMRHFGPDLTFTQVNPCSAFDFDGSRASVPLSPLLYPQALSPAALSAYRSQGNFKVFSDAQGKPRDDLFHQQRAAYRLLLTIAPTVMLCSRRCTAYEMGFPFAVPTFPLVQWIGVTVWFSSVLHLCYYLHLGQDLCFSITWQSIQHQVAKDWTTSSNPFFAWGLFQQTEISGMHMAEWLSMLGHGK